MPIVAVSRPLCEKLSDRAVDSLIDLLKQSQDEQKNDILEFVEEKFVRRLAEETSRLSMEIHKVHADLIKWMFNLLDWTGQGGFADVVCLF